MIFRPSESSGFVMLETVAANLILIFSIVCFSASALALAHGRTSVWGTITTPLKISSEDCPVLSRVAGYALQDCGGKLRLKEWP